MRRIDIILFWLCDSIAFAGAYADALHTLLDNRTKGIISQYGSFHYSPFLI